MAITACMTHLEGQTISEASIFLISTIFVCYSTPFFGDPDSDVKNAKFFHGRPSRPCLVIRLAITDCPGHLEGQTSPEASIRLISTIFVCYIAHHFLGDPDSDVKNAKFFSWTSVKTLSMHTVVHHGLSDPFGGSNQPQSEHMPHFDDFRVL